MINKVSVAKTYCFITWYNNIQGTTVSTTMSVTLSGSDMFRSINLIRFCEYRTTFVSGNAWDNTTPLLNNLQEKNSSKYK